jgi:hypothetical protein
MRFTEPPRQQSPTVPDHGIRARTRAWDHPVASDGDHPACRAGVLTTVQYECLLGNYVTIHSPGGEWMTDVIHLAPTGTIAMASGCAYCAGVHFADLLTVGQHVEVVDLATLEKALTCNGLVARGG